MIRFREASVVPPWEPRCVRTTLGAWLINPGEHPQHVERLAAYWADVMGGPPEYSNACGDHSFVLQLHAGNGDITDLARRFVVCFVVAADDAGLPNDPDFRVALRAYLEWAVLPRWSWDGLATSRRRTCTTSPAVTTRRERPPAGGHFRGAGSSPASLRCLARWL
jgi:hemoglobin